MKNVKYYLIVFIGIAVLSASFLEAGEKESTQYIDELARSHIKIMQDDGSITNVINLLISEGIFCQVRGHKWEAGCGVSGCLVIHDGPMRHCVVCGKTETREMKPWN